MHGPHLPPPQVVQRSGLVPGSLPAPEQRVVQSSIAELEYQAEVAEWVGADVINIHGGAIALGHPLGASGGRLMTTLVHEMRRRESLRGLATMCIGVGQGIATIVENVEAA